MIRFQTIDYNRKWTIFTCRETLLKKLRWACKKPRKPFEASANLQNQTKDGTLSKNLLLETANNKDVKESTKWCGSKWATKISPNSIRKERWRSRRRSQPTLTQIQLTSTSITANQAHLAEPSHLVDKPKEFLPTQWHQVVRSPVVLMEYPSPRIPIDLVWLAQEELFWAVIVLA